MLKSCFFIGHHNAPPDIRKALVEAIERHITDYGVGEFVVGHYGAFDRMVASQLLLAKGRHPEIVLTLLSPYHPGERAIKFPEDFDRSFYPPGMETVPRQIAIVRANQYMVQNTDYLICFNRGYVGNTRELVDLARKQAEKGRMHIENLAGE